MRSGSFRALGLEKRRPTNPAIVIPLVGMLQVFVFLFLPSIPAIQAARPEWLVYAFFASVGLAIVSGIAFTIVRFKSPPVGDYDVSYVNEKDHGGALKLTYTNTNGELREGLTVKTLRAYPHPLWKPGSTLMLQVQGTKCYLGIIFVSPRLALALAFPSLEEMNQVYEQLK